MTVVEGVLVLLAGMAAGTLNAVVGAGTLITFPTLLAIGVPPITANVSNTVGLVPGSVAGAHGFRRELAGNWGVAARMGVMSCLGGIAGGLLLLLVPEDAFAAVVPALLLFSGVLALLQPRVAAMVRRRAGQEHLDTRSLTIGLAVGVLLAGVYGGYFGAAQGVILLALLGISWTTDLNRANGVKNVLGAIVNGVSATVFVVSGEVDWRIAGLVAGGATVGGVLGARIGRRLPAPVLRALIAVVALVAAVAFQLRG